MGETEGGRPRPRLVSGVVERGEGERSEQVRREQRDLSRAMKVGLFYGLFIGFYFGLVAGNLIWP